MRCSLASPFCLLLLLLHPLILLISIPSPTLIRNGERATPCRHHYRRRRRCSYPSSSSSPTPPRAPPRRGISYLDALNQTAYVAERPPRSVLYTEGELTHDEHTRFIGLSQQMHEFKEGCHVPYELKHWKGFWDTVFENWDTTVGNADDRPLRPVTLSDNRIRAGRLKMSHPPSAEYPGLPGPNRLQNCPVYMSVSPSAQDQLLQAIWKDEGGEVRQSCLCGNGDRTRRCPRSRCPQVRPIFDVSNQRLQYHLHHQCCPPPTAAFCCSR